jgi:hypothetical protein
MNALFYDAIFHQSCKRQGANISRSCKIQIKDPAS